MVSEVDRDKLVAFLHGELSPLEAERLAARMQADEELRLEFVALQSVDDQLEDLFVQSAKEDLSAEQVTSLLEEAKVQPIPLKRRSYFTAGGVALAASFVLAVVMWTQQHPSKPARFSPAPEAMDSIALQEESMKRADEGTQVDRSDKSALAKDARRGEPESAFAVREKQVEGAADTSTAANTMSAAPSAPSALPAASVPAQFAGSSPAKRAMKAEESLGGVARRAAPADVAAATDLTEPSQNRGARAERARSAKTSKVAESVAKISQRSAPAVKAKASSAVVPNKWFACTKVSDCVIVDTGCDFQAVNRKFKGQLLQSSRTQIMDCKNERTSRKNSFKATCQKSMCVRKK